MKKLLLIVVILVFLLIPVLAFADTIYLTDGSVIKGDIIEINEDKITIETAGGTLVIDKKNVERIEFESNSSDKGEEDDDYAELREKIKAELESLDEEGEEGPVVVVVVMEKDDDEENDDNNDNDNNDNNDNNNNENENENDNKDNDYNNDDYDWANEEAKRETKGIVPYRGYISANIKGGIRLYKGHEMKNYLLTCLDMGFKIGGNVFMTASVGLPFPVQINDATETGLTGDFGFALLIQNKHKGFDSTGLIEIQVSVMSLHPVSEGNFFGPHDYDLGNSLKDDLSLAVMLNLVAGFNFRFNFFEIVTEVFIGMDLLRLGLNTGARAGIRFYIP